ncbi:MAG: hypothetical protein ACK4ND_08055 [Cytophagaceae bacterium]
MSSIFIELFLAFLTSLVLTVVFTNIFKIHIPRRGFGFLLVLIFLVTLAANRWVRPLGDPILGLYWLPGLLAGFITALIIAAATHDNKKIRSSTRSKIYEYEKLEEDEKQKKDYELALGIFFWVAVALLLFVIVAAVVL